MVYHSVEESLADLALLDVLTSPDLPAAKHGYKRRDSDLDPLLLAAAASSGPHVTRNHYAHDFFPGVDDPRAEGAWDWTKWQGDDARSRQERKPRLKYVSRQAPRRQRLKAMGIEVDDGKENEQAREATDPLRRADNLPLPISKHSTAPPAEALASAAVPAAPKTPLPDGDLEVKCMARTRVPTPHGPIFLHIYHNNRDDKEHLAIVVDPAQFSQDGLQGAPPIRSRSLDAVWSDTETDMDRITRGAYIGRLSPSSQNPSTPASHLTHATDTIPSPLVRIHSECFTGETIGSMRCDCGEQLDEAIRLISQPITVPSTSPNVQPTTIPGRGAVVYLRQEGRGIGLLSKIRAYNLQDLGHDTVTANLMLGYKADERGYEIAGAIMRDLGLGTEVGEGVRLLTNNPDKVQALEKEGIRIVERVPMIPRSWRRRAHSHDPHGRISDDARIVDAEKEVSDGLTMIGGGAVYGEDLDKYLRTKVLRMGHLLPLLSDDHQ
ncbi:GTP cyclohydrolase II-domain-containing protein [Amylocystis lapponica]|nr:GTP cyclohydrolase II-domain-containing protein [Amylocystis lapponica]